MKGGRFKKLRQPSGFTGKKPGDRSSSIYGNPDDAKSPKKVAAPAAKPPVPRAPKKPGDVLAIGISAGPKPPMEDALPEPPFDENPERDPLTDNHELTEDPGIGGIGGIDGIAEGAGLVDPGVKRFLGDAVVEKLMRLQR